jgi:hypothetical protein
MAMALEQRVKKLEAQLTPPGRILAVEICELHETPNVVLAREGITRQAQDVVVVLRGFWPECRCQHSRLVMSTPRAD